MEEGKAFPFSCYLSSNSSHPSEFLSKESTQRAVQGEIVANLSLWRTLFPTMSIFLTPPKTLSLLYTATSSSHISDTSFSPPCSRPPLPLRTAPDLRRGLPRRRWRRQEGHLSRRRRRRHRRLMLRGRQPEPSRLPLAVPPRAQDRVWRRRAEGQSAGRRTQRRIHRRP